MKKTILTVGTILLLNAAAQSQDGHFLPNHLAVLRAGNGVFSLNLRQSPIFVDQYDPSMFSAAPSFTVRIPTNGQNSFFFNGHAATEGNLTLSADHKLLAFAGYGGVDLLQVSGTASRLDIQRGFATVDNGGNVHTYLYKTDMSDAKVNPRGVATDGTNNFWGCGNADGTLYYNPAEHQPVRFTAFPNSRAIKIINNTIYVSMNAADGYSIDKDAGVYSFLPKALPRQADAAVNMTVRSAPTYKKVAGFDMNPAGNVAYICDTATGIQKYLKSDGRWAFAYNFSIPQNIPKDLNTAAGCFGLAVDFSGTAPILYATTTEGYGGSVNSNRVVKIIDTGANAAVATVAQAGSTNVAFRGIDFTPN